MLVDLGRNDLGRGPRPATVQVTDLMWSSGIARDAPCLEHQLRPWPTGWMRSTSSSPRPGRHPSGAPKVRAMEIIAELEDSPRGPYGGAIGYVSFSGNMDLAITIRTACIQKGVLTGGRGRHRGRFRPRARERRRRSARRCRSRGRFRCSKTAAAPRKRPGDPSGRAAA